LTLTLFTSRLSVSPKRLVRIAPVQRVALAALFVKSLLERDPTAAAEAQAQASDKAFRAPELLPAVARLEPAHADVPAPERHVALGAALMNLLLAAHGLGFGGMLTSGHALRTARTAQSFGLTALEQAVCFVAIGTATEVRTRHHPSANELMTDRQPTP
jgi:nitroreductase